MKLFDDVWQRLSFYHGVMLEKTAVLAWSGGRDSSLLLEFYLYLHDHYSVPKPVVYHLDHSIRNNREQEEEIAGYVKSLPIQSVLKKKTFRNLRPGLALP